MSACNVFTFLGRFKVQRYKRRKSKLRQGQRVKEVKEKAIHRKRWKKDVKSGKGDRIKEQKNMFLNEVPQLMTEWISVKTANKHNLNTLEDVV